MRADGPGGASRPEAGDYVMSFGKHRGKSLEWLFFHDPGYVWWLEEKFHDDPGIFPPLVRKHFTTLTRRATHLRLPLPCPACQATPATMMVLTSKASGRLASVTFCCAACAPAPGPLTVVGRPGFRTPDLYHEYDKSGGKVMIAAIKAAFFGDPSFRMTDERLQAFFADPAHFADP